ncbi:MAG: hypothetical protein LAT54_03920 [Cryomorphaceae bacterium]|nr:hypothetical protein [Cryomorphaceae bacterium]
MRWKSISFLLMSIAVLVLNLHAIIPHTHVDSHHDLTVSVEETSSSSPLDNLWHLDLGENHLEVFKLGPVIKLFFASQINDFSISGLRFYCFDWFFPSEENAIPPPSLDSKSLRAPPVFA